MANTLLEETDNEDTSCPEEAVDSDQVDSDLEAELYSLLHHDTSFFEGDCSIDQKSLSMKDSHNNSILESKLSVSPSNIPRKDDLYAIGNKAESSYISVKNNDCEFLSNSANHRKRKATWKHENSNSEYDSDSDSSVIITEPKSSDLSVNLQQSVIVISDSDESTSSVDDFAILRRFICNSKTGAKEDPWLVDKEDLYQPGRFKNRYHERAKMNSSFTMNHKCFLCGGKHAVKSCCLKVCHRCSQLGHDSKYCSEVPVSLYNCSHCLRKGHIIQNCPDRWRRYHLTTDNGEIIAAKNIISNNTPYCLNCGLSGHYGVQCTVKRYDRFSFQTFPNVLSYHSSFNTARSPASAKKVQQIYTLSGSRNRPSEKNSSSSAYRAERNVRKKEVTLEKRLHKKIGRLVARKKRLEESNDSSKTKCKMRKASKQLKRAEADLKECKRTVMGPVYFPRTPKEERGPHLPEQWRGARDRPFKRERRSRGRTSLDLCQEMGLPPILHPSRNAGGRRRGRR